MDNKSLFSILKGTIQGLNADGGSSKRITAMYFVTVLLTGLTGTYAYCYYISAMSLKSTEAQILIIKMYEPIHFSIQISVWMFFGLATIETITSLIKTIKGSKEEIK